MADGKERRLLLAAATWMLRRATAWASGWRAARGDDDGCRRGRSGHRPRVVLRRGPRAARIPRYWLRHAIADCCADDRLTGAEADVDGTVAADTTSRSSAAATGLEDYRAGLELAAAKRAWRVVQSQPHGLWKLPERWTLRACVHRSLENYRTVFHSSHRPSPGDTFFVENGDISICGLQLGPDRAARSPGMAACPRAGRRPEPGPASAPKSQL